VKHGASALSTATRALAALALGGFALCPLVPLLTRAWPAAAPLERALSIWFELHCERDPARTLSIGGVPLAVCARCTGIYFGIGLGALLRKPTLSALRLRLWVGIGAALMLLDVMLEERGLHGSLPALRLLSGALLAYPVGAGLGAAIARAPEPAQRP
jgi:uncharacterized membrane protein